MKQPEGSISDPSLVCKLKKSLYGLKRAPKEWYSKMDAFLLSQNFQMCKSDSNVYIHKSDGNFIIMVLYVYELLITSITVTSILVIKTALHNAFEMRDLGLEIEQNSDGIMATQSKYISNLLFKFNMAECRPTLFPFLSGISLEEGKSTPRMDCTIYQLVVLDSFSA